jgi:hypothetical protein
VKTRNELFERIPQPRWYGNLEDGLRGWLIDALILLEVVKVYEPVPTSSAAAPGWPRAEDEDWDWWVHQPTELKAALVKSWRMQQSIIREQSK